MVFTVMFWTVPLLILTCVYPNNAVGQSASLAVPGFSRMPPQAKSGLMSDLVNNVLMEYSDSHLPACCLWLVVHPVVELRCSDRDHMAHRDWSIYRGLLISVLNSAMIFWRTLAIKPEMADTAQERFIAVNLHQDVWSNVSVISRLNQQAREEQRKSSIT